MVQHLQLWALHYGLHFVKLMKPTFMIIMVMRQILMIMVMIGS